MAKGEYRIKVKYNIILILGIVTISFYSFVFYNCYRLDHLKVVNIKRYNVEATVIDAYYHSVKTKHIYVKGIIFSKNISSKYVLVLRINGKNIKQEVSIDQYFQYQDKIGEIVDCELIEQYYDFMNISKQSVKLLE